MKKNIRSRFLSLLLLLCALTAFLSPAVADQADPLTAEPAVAEISLSAEELFADEPLTVSVRPAAECADRFSENVTGNVWIDEYRCELGEDLTVVFDELDRYFGSNENREHTVRAELYNSANETAATEQVTFRLLGGPKQWFTKNGKQYYLNNISSRSVGLCKIDGLIYYFNKKGVMQTGWKTVDGQRFCFAETGEALVGKQKLKKKIYFFTEYGQPYIGWIPPKVSGDGHWYHTGAKGAAQTGWQVIDGERYRFSGNGQALSGWQTLKDGTYYFSESGWAYHGGLFVIDGQNCEFDAEGRYMAPVEDIRLSAADLTLARGAKAKVTVTVTPADAYNTRVSWSSSNKKVATVSAKGVITARSVGSATVTCRSTDGSELFAVCEVTVTEPVTDIILNKTSASVRVGKSVTLKPTVVPSGAARKVTWSVDRPEIASVSKSGKVRGLKKGTCVVTCESTDGTGVKVSCKIRVK